LTNRQYQSFGVWLYFFDYNIFINRITITTNKTESHDITEILLKVTLNTLSAIVMTRSNLQTIKLDGQREKGTI